MQLRQYQPGDERAIAEIFTSAVHEIGSQYYSPEQCLAWSDRQPNYAHWQQRCACKRPWVAVVESQIAGFLELDDDGHIDCAYINPRFQRRGIMTALVQHALVLCRARGQLRVYVEASLCAQPLFAKLGFRILCENQVRLGEVALVNYRMELMLPETKTPA